MDRSAKNIASVFEQLVSTNVSYPVSFVDGSNDEVIFKDVYLYLNGLNVKYFSKKENDLKTSLWEEIAAIDHKSIRDWIDAVEQAPSPLLVKPLAPEIDKSFERNKAPLGGPKSKVLLSVSRLTRLIKEELEQKKFQNIWVCGEVSNFTLAASGHAYFSLKDEAASIPAVMFRSAVSQVKFEIKNGLKVEVWAGVSVYAKRGSYQLLVKKISPEGIGELQLAFEQLKERLAEAGLFNPEHKKPIPRFPDTVGIITSPTGAALQDMIKTTNIEFPGVKLIIYPSLVQGERAAEEIAKRIELANEHKKCDVLIIGRGGGTVEDLWPFNEERVARAIFSSHLPIISAVGHEIDFTIADFVADYRAATPTAAAEHISRYKKNMSDTVSLQEKKIALYIHQRMQSIASLLDGAREDKLIYFISRRYQDTEQRLDELDKDLRILIQQHYQNGYNDFYNVATKLDALSPFKVLKRGYSVVYDEDQEIVTDARSILPGDEIAIQLHQGDLKATVIKSGGIAN